jgi:hypothetical protein
MGDGCKEELLTFTPSPQLFKDVSIVKNLSSMVLVILDYYRTESIEETERESERNHDFSGKISEIRPEITDGCHRPAVFSQIPDQHTYCWSST